ncbi:MAG: hypothetical protein QOG87_3804 [Actinomycetota bacterium]
MAPTVTFLAVDRWASVVAAIVAATVVATGLVLERHWRGERVGWVLPVSLGFVVFRGLVSVATRSDDVYFGIGVVASAAFALAVLGTAFTRSPVAVHAIPLVKHYESDVVTHPLYRRVATHVTMGWGVCHLAVSMWEASHLLGTSAVEFVAVRSFVGWPIMGFVVFWLVFYVRARLDPLEHRLRSALPNRSSGGD